MASNDTLFKIQLDSKNLVVSNKQKKKGKNYEIGF